MRKKRIERGASSRPHLEHLLRLHLPRLVAVEEVEEREVEEGRCRCSVLLRRRALPLAVGEAEVSLVVRENPRLELGESRLLAVEEVVVVRTVAELYAAASLAVLHPRSS